MEREEAIQVVRGLTETTYFDDRELEGLRTLIPELTESEDERIRKLLVWQVHRNIEDETNDLAGSIYDGIKGHDPDLEESIEDWKKCLAWLEKQKEQKPAEWSEEDKKMMDSIINELGQHYKTCTSRDCPSASFSFKAYQKEIDWLKSLRPQPHWKPSEEQMYSLGTVVKGYDECTVGSVGYNLKELYEHLKKLM